MPLDFTSLISCEVIIIPDTTETVQWDIWSNYGAVGEAYNIHNQVVINNTLAVTNNQFAGLDVTNVLTDLVAGDIVGMQFRSDTSNLRIVGIRIKYS